MAALEKLEGRLAEEFGYSCAVMFGRARSALVALLEVLDAHSQFSIWIPSNVCPELLAAVWASGASVQLLPVEHTTGLVSDRALADAVRTAGKGLAVATQLYGFRQSHPETAAAVRDTGSFLLENDTLATGSRAALGRSEPFAHATLVSFGYGKTIAVAGGALMLDDARLAAELRRKALSYPPLSEAAARAEAHLMQLRRAHGVEAGSRVLSAEELLLSYSIPNLRYGFPLQAESALSAAISQLGAIIEGRRRRAALWAAALRPFDDVLIAPAIEQVVPWRAIRRVLGMRNAVVAALRDAGFDAGTNFPSLARTFPRMLGDFDFDDARIWSNEVINLWVTEDYDQVRIFAAAEVIGKALRVAA